MLTKTFSFITNNSFKAWKGLVAMLALQSQLASGSRALTREHKMDMIQSCSLNVDYLSTMKEFCPATCTNWINSQLSAPERSIASSLSQDKPVEESYPSLSLKKQLESIVIQKVIDDSSIPEGFKTISASRREKARIKQALIAVNNAATLSSLIKHEVGILIVSEACMKKLTGSDDCTASYIIAPDNLILLNQHLFEGKIVKDPERYEQLVYALANEVSHAIIRNQHPKDQFVLNEKFNYKLMLPCKNEKQHEQIIKAYEAYQNNIEEYKSLVEKHEKSLNLTPEEKERLDKYDASLKYYITPRYGIKGYNAMQIHMTENEIAITMHENINTKVPPLSEPNERLEYLRKSFFYELETKKIKYRMWHKGKIHIYSGDENQLYADLISDFESLPSEARKVFGKDLCEVLANFFCYS